MKTHEAVGAFVRSAHAKGLSQNTIRWYQGILNDYIRMYPGELPDTPEELETFIMSAGGGDENRHAYFRTIRALYRYAERRLGLTNTPLRFIDAPKRSRKLPRPLTTEQLQQLLMFPHSGRMNAVLYFLADTGVRVSEMLSLSPESIRETADGWIVHIENGKTGQHLVPVSYDVAKMMVKYLPLNVSRGRMSHLITRAFKEAHVPGHAHVLRHTFGTLWRGDLSVLQRIMGHASITTTMMYRGLQTGELSRAHAEHSPVRVVLRMSRNML